MIAADPLLHLLIVVLLVLGATLRLTRFITSDTLGEWLIVGPLRRWADGHEAAHRAAVFEVVADVEGEELTPRAARFMMTKQRQLRESEPMSWQARLVSGADCPFCWGFWVGVAVTALTVVLAPLGVVGLVWLGILAVLTLNYIVGHISARIDG